LARELEEIRAEVQKSHEDRTLVAEQLQKLSEEVTTVRSERDHLANQEHRLSDDLEQLRQESTALRQERDRFAEEAEQAHDRISELAEEVRSLESKVAQSTVPTEVTADQQPPEELRSQLRKLQIQNEELRSVIHGLGITVG
jgi:chromosome segregation ATPase